MSGLKFFFTILNIIKEKLARASKEIEKARDRTKKRMTTEEGRGRIKEVTIELFALYVNHSINYFFEYELEHEGIKRKERVKVSLTFGIMGLISYPNC